MTLTCFTHKSHSERTDSFCFGQPAEIDSSARTISLDCPLRPSTDEDHARNAAELSSFPTYWYNTGPRAIIEQFITLDHEIELSKLGADRGRTMLLIKREGTVGNLWHTLMQIISVWLSLDILRTTRHPVSGEAMYSDRDVENTQAVILDSFDDGPFYELWSMFGGLPTVRFDSQLEAESSSKGVNVLIPLPGGSNPFWQGDWVDLDCDDSASLRAFRSRVLNSYDIRHEEKTGQQLTLLFIDRRGSRRLHDQDALISVLLSKFSMLKVRVVDFAALSVKEQLQAVAKSDILVGVHGAGLTHGMFMKDNSTVVEIQPPGLKHKGFKNMAKFLGHDYFSEHGEVREYEGRSGDWHFDEVFMQPERFLGVIGRAIEAAEWKRTT